MEYKMRIKKNEATKQSKMLLIKTKISAINDRGVDEILLNISFFRVQFINQEKLLTIKNRILQTVTICSSFT